MSNPIFWEKQEKNIFSLSAAKFADSTVSIRLVKIPILTLLGLLSNSNCCHLIWKLSSDDWKLQSGPLNFQLS